MEVVDPRSRGFVRRRIEPARGRTYPAPTETVNRIGTGARGAARPVSSEESRPAWRETLDRWLTENVADTRRDEDLEGRVYQVAFARVWDELLADISAHSSWTLDHKDEELGIMTVSCRSLVLRFIDDMTIWVALDDNGLTRVEALSRARVGRGDFGVNRRRIEGLLARLDAAVGEENRLTPSGRRRGTGRPGPGDPPSSV